MAMNRAQMFKQVRGYARGGVPGAGGIAGLSEILGLTPAQSILGGAPPSGFDRALMTPTPQMASGFNLPAELDPAGAEILPGMSAPLLEALTPQASSRMAPAGGMSVYDELISQARREADKSLDERRQEYMAQLEAIMGERRPAPDIYDLASSIGRAMLSADPRAGAFRSMGAGFADFSERVKELEEQQRQQDRQLALKAYDLARTDEQAAKSLVRDYMIMKAKERPDEKLGEYVVVDEAGINIGGRTYMPGETILLDNREARMLRTRIKGTGGEGGWKAPEAALTAVWQDRASAEATIKSLGMSEDNPNFEGAVSRITAPNPSMIGKPIIIGGAYTELRPYVKGDNVFNVVMGSSDAAGTPYMTTFTEERLKALAKGRSDIMSARQTVQRTRAAREQLRTDPTTRTGKIDEALLPIRQLAVSAFGLDDDELVGLESLEAVLNYLGPRMRVAGSGPTSDRDMKIQMSSVGTLGNRPQANYISLYAFERMTENAQRLAQLEEEALTSGRFSSTAELNRFLEENDPGLFERFDGDPENEAALQAWYDSLPDGAVIDNTQGLMVDADGNPIKTPFIIKGWVARK
jgi:hypothetical protein